MYLVTDVFVACLFETAWSYEGKKTEEDDDKPALVLIGEVKFVSNDSFFFFIWRNSTRLKASMKINES